jgi:hypothetical protein
MVTLACVSSPTPVPGERLKNALTSTWGPLPCASEWPSKPPPRSGVIGSFGCHTVPSKGSSRWVDGTGKGVEDASEKHAKAC